MSSPADDEQGVVAVPWYRPSQWDRLREISVDGARELGESYNQWHAFATRRLNELRRGGRQVEKVAIDVEELLQWCKQHERLADAGARAEFAAAKLEEKYRRGQQG